MAANGPAPEIPSSDLTDSRTSPTLTEMGLDVPFRVMGRRRLVATVAVAFSLMGIALAGDVAAASPDPSEVVVSEGTATASQEGDPCHARPRPPGCPAQGGSGGSMCDDPEYVENFYEGDRAACLNEGGCTYLRGK